MHCNRRGQATTELALMGSIIIMLIAYLMQQGVVYNAKQGLEMYAFREALRQSQKDKRGITLTVVRDIMAPTFFTGITRQRLMATSSAEMNPYIYWEPDKADDITNKQLVQIGEPMIRKGVFVQTPAIKVTLTTRKNGADAQWVSAPLSELDAQSMSNRVSSYSYSTDAQELGRGATKRKSVAKDLVSYDDMTIGMKFEKADKIQESYVQNEWRNSGDEEAVTAAVVDPSTMHGDAYFKYKEQLRRQRTTSTPF